MRPARGRVVTSLNYVLNKLCDTAGTNTEAKR
jgi:hypothetical protein